MGTVNVRNVIVDGDTLYLQSRFKKFSITKDSIEGFKIERIPSLFDEIGITINCGNNFLITERANGFFDLAKILDLEQYFGPLWYSDVENGLILTKEG